MSELAANAKQFTLDAKDYLTAGEYPGDGLGEIFVKLGKQGSTLSGLLDAFAISRQEHVAAHLIGPYANVVTRIFTHVFHVRH